MQIGVLGAGAIGCYLGASLACGGASSLRLIGRERLAKAYEQHGLQRVGLDGRTQDLSGLQVSTDATTLADCQLILVCVKSGQTRQAAEQLAGIVSDQAVIVSFQNGLRNPEQLAAAMPQNPVLAGMVPFNVVWERDAHFRQTTSGSLVLQDAHPSAAELAQRFREGGLAVQLAADITGLQWGKLLLNLNNPVNALSGLPLKEELSDRGYRRCLAASVSEALAVLKAAQIEPHSPLKAPLSWLPRVLRLPTPLFRVVASAMLKIDENARSSMYDDLERGRRTEVDILNGEIVALAASQGRQAPINAKIVALMRDAEERAEGSPLLSSRSLAATLGL